MKEMKSGDLIEKRIDPSCVQYVYYQVPLHLHTARVLDFRIGAGGEEEILVQKVYVCYEWELKNEWQVQNSEKE